MCVTETWMWDETTHRTLEAQHKSTVVSTNSFKTPYDDQWESKHVVYNVDLNKLKRLIVYM
jgi:hypothetical protein